jgi:ammonia channel protein AmtB
MRFVLKTAFFIQAVAVFVIFNFFTIIRLFNGGQDRHDALVEIAMGWVIYVFVIGVPWFLVARSSLSSAKNCLEDLRGSVDYLKKTKASPEKVEHAVSLYNQEVDTLDQVMGEFPSRQLAGFFFNYRRPAYLRSGIKNSAALADKP